MKELARRVCDYIEHLRSFCSLNVTVHSSGESPVEKLMGTLAPYNIHSCGYCMYMKTNSEIWDKCIQNQKKVAVELSKHSDGFFGMCYLGVCEYVYPIFDEDLVIGFICVSGYKESSTAAEQRIKHACTKFGLDFENVMSTYNSELSSEIPDKSFVDTVVYPLICMIKQLICQTEPLNDHAFSGGESYIYSHILTFIHRNFRKNITLDDLCGLCHCSKSYISHTFPKHSGTSISAYINSLRIKEAKVLLKNSSLSIRDIAFDLGFNDSNYFTNVFKKQVGISPRGYREQKNNKSECTTE